MFKDFILDIDKSNHNKQLFYCNKSSKIKELEIFYIYTGIWGDCKSSIPLGSYPSIDCYRFLTINLLNNHNDLLPINCLDFNVHLKNDLNRYLYKYVINYCDYELVPIDLVKQLLQELYSNLITEQKSGGVCRKCGEYDDYAPIDSSDGKCFCYKCFK
jgi:hypothetical protein